MTKRIVGGLCAALALAIGGGAMLNAGGDANAAPAKKQATKKQSQKDAQRRYLDELIADNEAMSRGGPSSCYDTSRTTAQQQRVLRNMGGEPCARSTPPAISAPSASVVGWSGTYAGQFDGGMGTVTIGKPDPRGRHKVDLVVLQPGGCSGEVSATGQPSQARFDLSAPNMNGGMCEISLTKRGNILTVQEAECGDFHGASCAFVGSATRKSTPIPKRR